MTVWEWVAKSKAVVLREGSVRPKFKSPAEEFKELQIELTYACNLRCRMCDIWSRYEKDPHLPRREMPVEELIDYLQESRILKGMESVILSGGEPFLKKDFLRLVGYFLVNYPRVKIGILSNLYNPVLVVTRLEEIRKAYGLQRLWIGTSLDGLEQAHNNTRGVPDAFAKIKQTLSVLRSQMPEVAVTANYTLTTDNYHDLFDAYMFCRAQGFSLSVQFPVPWPGAENFSFSSTQIDEIEVLFMRIVAEEIKDHEAGRLHEGALLSKIFYLSGLIDYQRQPRRVFRRCVAGRRFVGLSPEGEIYACPVLKNACWGSLRDGPFDRIFAGKSARQARDRIDRGYCHCWLNCTIYPNAGEAVLAYLAREQTAAQRVASGGGAA